MLQVIKGAKIPTRQSGESMLLNTTRAPFPLDTSAFVLITIHPRVHLSTRGDLSLFPSCSVLYLLKTFLLFFCPNYMAAVTIILLLV